MDYIKTWREVILRPSDFYRRMPTTGGYINPITFVAINCTINGLLLALIRPSMLKLVRMHDLRYNISTFTIAIVSIIASIIGLFVLALIFILIYKSLGGTGSYEGTVRFVAYASAPVVFSWIPILGLIPTIYNCYLCIVGGMIVHNVSMKRSAIAVLPIVILTMFPGVRSILSSFAH
jgi:hypothetical protein